MPALTEQRPHLLLGHFGADRKVWHGGKAPPHPPAWGFALLAVVVAQRAETALGRVVRGDLPGQVGVAIPSSELVQAHHTHTIARPCATARGENDW